MNWFTWKHLLGQATQLRHRIAHGREQHRDAVASAACIALKLRDNIARRAIRQPCLQSFPRVVGGVVQIEELLGIGQRRVAVLVDIDVKAQHVVEARDGAAGIRNGGKNDSP